ncbi:hypothetical protein TELCIR_05335 [Teladorsagia circumcincta]|uniref:Uncharacterized protein n=1 Tax=Teladorsagia circumcincta TaxID=45464 RepID=A0A2G9UR30_TELCI|nr:hypothetical protein TELCIR_05335 [Teladorsagia circumcincta]
MASVCSASTDCDASETTRTIFVCGFVAKRWHNSSLQAIIQDLLPEYYVACNSERWDENTPTRSLLKNAEAMLFFVNEFTLGDKNCLMNLQYAWHLMVPLIVLRPPRTKLVICKREQTCDNIVYGYKLSLVYDRQDHAGSMRKISERVQQVMRPTLRRGSHQTPAFYLSPSNGPELIERAFYDGEITTERAEKYCTELSGRELRVTRSLGNLENKVEPNFPRTPYPHMNGSSSDKIFKIPPIETNKEDEENYVNSHQCTTTVHPPPSTISRTSSRDGRMSMGSLDDVNSFQETQYLVFPIRNSNNKPKLIKFPEDLMEEGGDHSDSIWGSETSLEEDDAEVAMKINGGISIDDNEEESQIGSPAPYIGDL